MAAQNPVIIETVAFDYPVKSINEDGQEMVYWPRLVFAMDAETRKIRGIDLLAAPEDEDILAAERLLRAMERPKRMMFAPLAPAQVAAERAARWIRDVVVAEWPEMPGACAGSATIDFRDLSHHVDAAVKVYNASIDLAPAAPPSALVLTPRAIPHEDLTYLREMASRSMTIGGRVEMICHAARLAFDMRAAAQDYYEISAEHCGDAIAMEADDIAWRFTEAEEEAVSSLLLLICGEDADVAMLAIQRRCADLPGVS